MKRFNNFHPFNVFSLELEIWEFELHQHNFYELIFIEKGKGIHLLNEISFKYKKGDVFLITPNDAHEFIIENKTIFTFIKFTELFFSNLLEINKLLISNNTFETILKQDHLNEGCAICDKTDKKHVFSLLKIIQHEFLNTSILSKEIIQKTFFAVMMLIARNKNSDFNSSIVLDKDTERLNSILSHIRTYVLDNEKMKLKNIATQFHLSPNYISIYIKKHTGISLQQYVIKMKMKLAEKLLEEKKLNINEIATKLGFNDSSHFNKLFKNHRGISPSVFSKGYISNS